MAMRRSYSDHGERYSAATISATVASEREIPESCGDRSASRRRTRWISARERRVIARWLRRTADVAPDPHPILRRQDPSLHGRAAAVHGELLELAALVERVDDPDPACYGRTALAARRRLRQPALQLRDPRLGSSRDSVLGPRQARDAHLTQRPWRVAVPGQRRSCLVPRTTAPDRGPVAT